MTDKQKKGTQAACLAQMREDCCLAAGAARLAGLLDAARALHWISTAPLGSLLRMRYTGTLDTPTRAHEKEEKVMKARAEAQKIAARIAACDTWQPEDCAALCSLAGLAEEWSRADGDSFEAVLYRAAEKLGVEI